MAALADVVKDLEKKTADAKTRVAGGIAFLKDAKKVAAAGLNDKKKMSGFISAINLAVGRAKEVRDGVLQSKDYKAITNAKDPLKVKFTAQNDILIKQLQADLAKLRDAAAKIEAAPPKKAKETPKNVGSLSDWNAVMTDKEIGPKVIKFVKTSMNEESAKFLSMMKQGKKDKNTYELFIKAGAKQQVNIANELRKKFDEVAKAPKPDWGKAPWEAATKEVLRLFSQNVLAKVA